MVAHRWPNGVDCPTCGRKDVTYLANQKKWQCKSAHAKRQFTAKVGTIFEDSPLGLEKWLPAVWMIATAKNGVSSCEIARSLGVTQKTAWFMLHRIRKAMQNGSMMKIGGKVRRSRSGRNFHRRQGPQHARQQAAAPHHWHWNQRQDRCHGILERGGQVRATVVPNRKRARSSRRSPQAC